MIVYTENISERLSYTMHYVFHERLGIAYQCCTDLSEFSMSKQEKLNYSNADLACLQIIPNTLLFEDFISDTKPNVEEVQGMKVLFSNAGVLGFDIFSAIFWMLSRYEEYQPYIADEHQRFSAKASLAFEKDFLKTPIVDVWILALKVQLHKYYPNLKFKEESYSVKPTIDIDNPWYYKNKGLYRTMGGMVRDGLANNWGDILYRLKILLGLEADPHYVFDYMDELFSRLELEPKYFLHVGDYGKYDKSINFTNRPFRLLLARVTYHNAWGIHPSYQASSNNLHLDKEIKRLEKVSGKPVKHSRHHYLKVSIPQTYRTLLEKGVERDYSMGYADKVGFRAGTSRPFAFFDLEQNKQTTLKVYPFAAMDATLKNYEQVNHEEVLQHLNDLIIAVKSVDGEFVTLWHNESLSDFKEWLGWRNIYEKMLKTSLG